MRKSTVIAAALVLVAAFAGADEDSGSPPFLYVVDAEVEKMHIGGWTDAVKALIRAHEGRSDGASWAVFRELTGGPQVDVMFFRGFSTMAELDGWPVTRRVLVDALGPVEGGAVKDALERGVDSSDRVMSRVDELSNPWISRDPPRYLWVATVVVAEGKMTEYAALAKRVRRAFEDQVGDLRWICYANAIGGERRELSFFYGFDTFSEVDRWPSRREVLATSLGDRMGERLASAIESITETTTSLWKLEPDLSLLGEQ